MAITRFTDVKINQDKLKEFTVSDNNNSETQGDELTEFMDIIESENPIDINGRGRQADQEYNDGGLNIPMIYQDDYENIKLGSTNVKDGGCGYTSIAMVLSYLTGEKISPKDIVEWGDNYYIDQVGMDFTIFLEIPERYNVNVTPAYYIEDAVKALKEGKPVICSQGEGLFTGSGHFIVLRGIDENGNILVNDTNKENSIGKGYNDRAFTPEEIAQSASQYWIFE